MHVDMQALIDSVDQGNGLNRIAAAHKKIIIDTDGLQP